jgi:trehalose 6-phosphate phosphatase
MDYLFSRQGMEALETLQADTAVIGFDFDGTLAPIVDAADAAKIPSATVKQLRRLSQAVPVTVISGRWLRDLKPRLGFEPRFVIGNHGLEAPWTKATERKAERLVKSWSGQLDWTKFAGDPGTYLENKRYSLSLHFRLSQHPRAVERKLREQVSLLDPPPRVISGKCLLSLTPEGAPNKGTAMLHVLKSTKRPCGLFVGDDDTDEDVFRLGRPDLLTIRVGRSPGSAARFYLKDQNEVEALVRWLADWFSSV